MQGTAYAQYVADQLTHERARRDALNSRAATAVTSTTGLATLTFAAVTFARGQTRTLGVAATVLALAAVAVVLLAAVLAIVAGFNSKYDAPSIQALHTMLGEHWGDSETTALSVSASTNLTVISSLRRTTETKMKVFIAAQFAQAGSVLLLGCALAAAV